MTRAARALALAAALALAGPAGASTAADVEATLERAEAERKKAAAVEYEWRFTGKHIKDARKLLSEGKVEEAMGLAERALFEAEAANEQHKIAEQVWMLAVPR